jgi:ABC-2 type transport system ATP-binding protein
VLPASMTVPQVLAFHRRVFPTWDAALECELLERFGLGGSRARIGQLSKGQARQVALICAVCHRPELLILDESADGLDAVARRELLETSLRLLNREGTAILFSSHHLTDVERLGGRVVVLDDGHVALDEPLETLAEEHCVAMIPRGSIASAALLQGVTGCLNVRQVPGLWHAVFRGSVEQTERRIAQELGLTDASCVHVRLEELFVDLLGGEREGTASAVSAHVATLRSAFGRSTGGPWAGVP